MISMCSVHYSLTGAPAVVAGRIIFLDLQNLDKFSFRESQEKNNITGIIRIVCLKGVCAHGPSSSPARVFFFFFLVDLASL